MGPRPATSVNRSFNRVSLDHPNSPIYTEPKHAHLPFGEFLTTRDVLKDPFNNEVGSIRNTDMYLPHFSVRISEGLLSRDAVLMNSKGEGTELLGSCLFLKGTVKSLTSRTDDGPVSVRNSQNFKFDPNNEILHLCPADIGFHIVHFSADPDYFLPMLPENERWSEELREKILRKESILGPRFTPITLLQQHLLQNILQCPLKGKMAELVMESSILQIMLLQLHALYQSEHPTPASKIIRRDLEMIRDVKEYLTRHFLEDHCLQQLAKEFATNTNKLMSLFKKAYGKSIFEYLAECKMDYARQLLKERDQMVMDVARIVGYKNAHHFSAAFKKRFGVSPTRAAGMASFSE